MRKFLALWGLITGFAVLSILSLILAGQTESRPIDDLMEAGKEYAIGGFFAQAEKQFMEILSQDPENATAHNNLGNSYLLEGKYISAILSYLKAIEYDKYDTNIYLNLGIVYYLQRELTPETHATTKGNWKAHSDQAFDEAFGQMKRIRNLKNACELLGIPDTWKAEYRWLQELLTAALERAKADAEQRFRDAAGYGNNQRAIVVYWKP